MWRKGNPPHVTDRHGRNSINDFPLVPEQPKVIVELVGLDHPDHPINREKRAKEEKARLQSQLEQAAIRAGSPSRASSASRGAGTSEAHATAMTHTASTPSPLAAQPDDDPTADPSDEFGLSKPAREFFRRATPQELHALHCTVCTHPLRAMIEEEFLHWISPDRIGRKYDLGWRCIYRHAHATGLYEQRYRNVRASLAHVIEYAGELSPTPRDVIRAVHHLARINAKGQWIEPTKRVVLSSANPTRRALAPVDRGDPARIDIPSERSEPRGGTKRSRRASKPRKQVTRKTR